jgi:hypothetical protein
MLGSILGSWGSVAAIAIAEIEDKEITRSVTDYKIVEMM